MPCLAASPVKKHQQEKNKPKVKKKNPNNGEGLGKKSTLNRPNSTSVLHTYIDIDADIPPCDRPYPEPVHLPNHQPQANR